ncbi:TPA: hypothetical protein J1508_003662, partial [Escherichia coli]|nr:hypothetical protein [Escherichia coli]
VDQNFDALYWHILQAYLILLFYD